jgi:hypothetical protein
MRSAREGDELRTGINMRALLSAIASGKEEIEKIGRKHGWSVGVREEMLDRLQAMVREPMQRGSDIIMSSIPPKWREQATLRVSKAEGVIRKITGDTTTEDWSLQYCQDYLVELEMVTSGALMALRLTANDISSEQVSQQAEHLGSKAREAKNMALELRQKHLDAKLQVKDRPARVRQEAMGGTSGPGPGRWRGYCGPRFSGRLEDLREFRRSWEEYEKQYLPKEPEEVLMEILHTQGLGPKARRAVEQAHSLGTTWTYLEDHLREQRERIDNLLSDTLRTGELASPEDLYLYYRRVCQFLDAEEGESKVDNLITEDQLDMLLCMLPPEETFKWRQWRGDGSPGDMPLTLYDFCWQRAANLRAQVQSLERVEEEVKVTAWHSGYPRWFGPCILGDICGSYHMPEVCRMFENMSPEGRLSVIQKKGLCQFCLRHPDTERCPSQSEDA